MTVLAQRGTLGAMGPEVDRGIKHRLLADPDTVFDHRVDRATDRAVGADRAFDFDLAVTDRHASAGGMGFFDQGQARRGNADPHAQTGSAQKHAAVHGGQGLRQAATQAMDKR